MKKQKEKSTFGWIMEFAGEKKNSYGISVALAICGALCHIMPFFLMAGVVKLLFAGCRDFSAFLPYLWLMLLFWVLRVTFHGASTSFSGIGVTVIPAELVSASKLWVACSSIRASRSMRSAYSVSSALQRISLKPS